MSRGQSTQAFNTASSDQATNEKNAQSTFGSTENAIGNYNNQLAKFVSSNPYTQGGEYDQTINTGLANTSDAGANSLAGALQSQAKRTGQNSAADAATAASNAQQDTRNLSSDMASAQQQRIGSEAGYNQTALGASSTPISDNQALYGTSTSAAQGNLGTEEGAAQTPSFWDEVGNGLAGGLGGALSRVNVSGGGQVSYGGGGGGGGCWVAAAVFNGWSDPRVHLVRSWIFGPFSESRIGSFVSRAYLRYGERTAALIHRFPVLKRVFLPLFNAALKQAERTA